MHSQDVYNKLDTVNREILINFCGSMILTKIFQHEHISTRTFIIVVLLIIRMSISLYYLHSYRYLYLLTM